MLTKKQGQHHYKPLGLFYLKENGMYVGIDNSAGDAWVEDFYTKEGCEYWLRGGEVI